MSVLFQIADNLLSSNPAPQRLPNRIPSQHSNNNIWKPIQQLGKQRNNRYLQFRIRVPVNPVISLNNNITLLISLILGILQQIRGPQIQHIFRAN